MIRMILTKLTTSKNIILLQIWLKIDLFSILEYFKSLKKKLVIRAMLNWYTYMYVTFLSYLIAPSSGAVEYTDWFSAEG